MVLMNEQIESLLARHKQERIDFLGFETDPTNLHGAIAYLVQKFPGIRPRDLMMFLEPWFRKWEVCTQVDTMIFNHELKEDWGALYLLKPDGTVCK